MYLILLYDNDKKDIIIKVDVRYKIYFFIFVYKINKYIIWIGIINYFFLC